MKQKLFNPFLQVAGLKAFAVGLIFVIASTLLSWVFNTKFDGVLDAHFGESTSLKTQFLINLINICCLVAVFYLLAIVLTKGKTRFVDILGTMTLARFPFVLIPLINIGNINGRIGEKIVYSMRDKIPENVISDVHCQPCTVSIGEYIYLVFSIIVVLLIIVWYVTLLFRAYQVSTNLKRTKIIVSFIAGIILAEFSSSFLIHYFL